MIIIFESELQENINDTILKKYKNLIKKLSIDNRVLCICKDNENGEYYIEECCDNYFRYTLTKEDCLQLAKLFNEIANTIEYWILLRILSLLTNGKKNIMEKEIQLFTQLPELLLCGNDNGIVYDKEEVERRFIDGMQRTSNIEKFRNRSSLLKETKMPDVIWI